MFSTAPPFYRAQSRAPRQCLMTSKAGNEILSFVNAFNKGAVQTIALPSVDKVYNDGSYDEDAAADNGSDEMEKVHIGRASLSCGGGSGLRCTRFYVHRIAVRTVSGRTLGANLVKEYFATFCVICSAIYIGRASYFCNLSVAILCGFQIILQIVSKQNDFDGLKKT